MGAGVTLSDEQKQVFIERYAAGDTIFDIANRFGMSPGWAAKTARRLHLKARDGRRGVKAQKAEGKRIAGCVHHRRRMKQPSPILLRQPSVNFGMPIKFLDDETQRLINEALAARGKDAAGAATT